MESPNRAYVPEIDHLRAGAALLILLYHGQQLIGSWIQTGKAFNPATGWSYPSNPLMTLIVEGHSAVSMFLVLSGFILTFGVLTSEVNYLGFVRARALRIYPMLIVCLLLAVLTTRTDLQAILTALNPIDAQAGVNSVFTTMFWAVKVELQCYLLFPLLLVALQRTGIRALVLIVLCMLALRVLFVVSTDVSPLSVSYWSILGRLDQFAIGMIAAKIWKQQTKPLPAVWFVAAVMALLLLLTGFNRLGGWPQTALLRLVFPPIEAAVWAAFIVTYVSAGRLLPPLVSKPLAALGTISYSAYLLHFVAIELVIQQQWWLVITGRADWDAMITTLVIVFPVVTAIAAITYQIIERPFINMRPRYARRRVAV